MSSNSAHYVAPTNTESVPVDQLRLGEKKSNLWIDAWRDLRRRPTFWISVLLCAIIVAMAVAPTLFPSPRRGAGRDRGCGTPAVVRVRVRCGGAATVGSS